MLHHGTLLCETNNAKTSDRMTCIDICGSVVGIGTSSGTIAFSDIVVDTSRLKACTRHIAIPPTNPRTIQNRISSLRFSSCARYLAIGMHSGVVSIFHFISATCHISPLYSYHEHQAPISCLTWADDASRLYSGCFGGRVVELNLSRLPSDDLLQFATAFFSRPTTLVEQCSHTIYGISSYLSHNYDYLLITAGHAVIYYQLSRVSSDSNRRNVIDKSHHARGRYSVCFLTQDNSIQLFRLPPTASKTQSVSIIVCRPGTTNLFTCAVSNGSLYHCYDLEPVNGVTAVTFTHLQPIYNSNKLLGILALTSSHQLAVIHLPTCKYQVLPIYQDITAIHVSERYILACISDTHFMVDVIQWFYTQEWRLPMRIFTTNLHMGICKMQSKCRRRHQPRTATTGPSRQPRWEVLYNKIEEILTCAFASTDMDLEKYNLELGSLPCDDGEYAPLINLDDMLLSSNETLAGAPMRRHSKLVSLEHEQLMSIAKHSMLNDMRRRERLQCIMNSSASNSVEFEKLDFDDMTKEVDKIVDSSHELLDLVSDSHHSRTFSDCSHFSSHSMDIDALLAAADMYTRGICAGNSVPSDRDYLVSVCEERILCNSESDEHSGRSMREPSGETELEASDSSDRLSYQDRCSEVLSASGDSGLDWLQNCGGSWIDAWHDASPISDIGKLKCRLGHRKREYRIPNVVELSSEDIDCAKPNTYVVTLRVPHGIGINLSYEDGALIVKGFSDLGEHENPALLCGMIQAGDVLIGVNEQALDHLPIEFALRVIRSFLDASSKADDPIVLTFHYGDTYRAAPVRDDDNPLFDLFTSITGEELVVAEHLIQNNFVSADSFGTPNPTSAPSSDDDPWFSVAELVREKIKTSHLYPSSAVTNACSNTIDSRVLLSGIISDMWNNESMRRALQKYENRKVVKAAPVVQLRCIDAHRLADSLAVALTSDCKTHKEALCTSHSPLSVTIPDAVELNQSTSFPVARYLLQHTLRNVHNPTVSPLRDSPSLTLDDLQRRLLKSRRLSDSVIPDAQMSQSVYNFVKAAPLVHSPHIVKLLGMLLDTFRPVQPISSTNHVSNKYTDKHSIIVEKLVTLYALLVTLKPAVSRVSATSIVPRFATTPDILMYRDGLQSYLHSFLADFSIDIRHLPENDYTTSERDVTVLFEKYGNYINLDVFALACSIRQYNSLLQRCIAVAQNHTLVRVFRQKMREDNVRDHFYLLSATNKMSGHVLTYVLAQATSLWTTHPSFTSALCVSLYPYVTAWNVHQLLMQCYPRGITEPRVFDALQLQHEHSLCFNEQGFRLYYHYLRQVLSVSSTDRLAEPTSAMILHFIECCLFLHDIDNASSYLDDMSALQTDVCSVDQQKVALMYLKYGYVSGVVDVCYSYLDCIEKFGFSLSSREIAAFQKFDEDVALKLLESSLLSHLRAECLNRIDNVEEYTSILSDIFRAMRQFQDMQAVIAYKEVLMKKRTSPDHPKCCQHSFCTRIVSLLKEIVSSGNSMGSDDNIVAEKIALGIHVAFGPRICLNMIKQWPWAHERLKFSFYRKIVSSFEEE